MKTRKAAFLLLGVVLSAMSCDRTGGGPHQGLDAPAPLCPLDDHVARIMEGQSSIENCIAGASEVLSDEQIAAYSQCVITAFDNQRPFRAYPVGGIGYDDSNPPAIVRNGTMLLGRSTASGFECVEIQQRGSDLFAPLTIVATSLSRSRPTFTQGSRVEDGGRRVTWVRPSCTPDPIPRPSPSPAAYDPPRVVPLGQVCPRD